MKHFILSVLSFLPFFSGCSSTATPDKPQAEVKSVKVQEGTRVRIGVPSDKPQDLLANLESYFKTDSNVTLAKLGLVERLDKDGSHFFYAIGIQLKDEGKRNQLMVKIGTIVNNSERGRWPLMFPPLNEQYFTKEAIQFYSLK